MKLAILTLSEDGLALARRLAQVLPESAIFVHCSVPDPGGAKTFAGIAEQTRGLFQEIEGLIYVAPSGVAVRAIAPLLESKLVDPAVVVVDVRGRFAVSLLSGHEGGANDLALQVANALGAEPIVTTTSEARKTLIVGLGCRRGCPSARIEAAVRGALERIGRPLAQVRLLASVDRKAREPGLQEAARSLGIPLRFIAADEIRASAARFRSSGVVERALGLPAVAEPACLLAGRRTRLLLPRNIIDGVTVAVAEEGSWSSASDPAESWTGPTGQSRPSAEAR